MGLTPIEKVKRTNVAMMNLNQQTGFMPRYNLYIIDVDCYNLKLGSGCNLSKDLS